MTMLDSVSEYGLRVTVEKVTPVHFVVEMRESDGELLRSKTTCTEKFALVWAGKFLS